MTGSTNAAEPSSFGTLTMSLLRTSSLVFVALLASSLKVSAQDDAKKSSSVVMFSNVRVFDGQSKQLSEATCVLVVGDTIKEIRSDIIAPKDATVIEGDGRTLMPGLIDNHWHAMFAAIPQAKLLQSDIGYINHVAGDEARKTLLRGFTSVRDVGGAVHGLKRAIDEGVLEGPRIYPSGAYISQTSGHGDFRGPNDVPAIIGGELDYFQRLGFTLIADGKPEVIKRTREVLRGGATQVKVMAGGGVSSNYDSLDATQYTMEEMKAIVDVTDTWNTYVTVHAFTDHSVRQAIEAGVKCIEHGHLMSEKTIKMLAEKDVWLSMQPILNDEDAIPFAEGSENQRKYLMVTDGTDFVLRMARIHKVKLAWGTDTLFDPALCEKQGKQLAKMARWFDSPSVLKMATFDNAQLLKLCGPRDPYPGELGVVKKDALADLILVDGNPLEDVSLVADPHNKFVVIMKDGKIHKNSLH